MLYHRLLKDLISASPAFDFDSLWKRMKLKSSEVFSTKFLVQAGLITENDSFRMVCLDDLARAWADMVPQLGACEVDSNLQLVYRLQPATPKWKCKDKGKTQEPIHITQEDQDLARAIEASLSDQHCGPLQNKGPDAVSARTNISIHIEEPSHEDPQELSGVSLPALLKDGVLLSGQDIKSSGASS
jgi:exonuclease V